MCDAGRRRACGAGVVARRARPGLCRRNGCSPGPPGPARARGWVRVSDGCRGTAATNDLRFLALFADFRRAARGRRRGSGASVPLWCRLEAADDGATLDLRSRQFRGTARLRPVPAGSAGRSGLGRSANPAPGGRPAAPGTDPHAFRPCAAAASVRERSHASARRRENRQPFDLLRPIPPKGRTRRIRPPAAALAPSLTNRLAAARPESPAAPGPHPLTQPKSGRRSRPAGGTPPSEPDRNRTAAFRSRSAPSGVLLNDPRHPASGGAPHPSKSRANVRPV